MARQYKKTVKNIPLKKQHNPYLKTLKTMEKKLNHSFKKLNSDIKKGANYKTIQKDNTELLLLLGECNYIARECHFFDKKIKKQK